MGGGGGASVFDMMDAPFGGAAPQQQQHQGGGLADFDIVSAVSHSKPAPAAAKGRASNAGVYRFSLY